MERIRNMNFKIEGNKLIIEVDLTQSFGPSKSGKTTTIASTGGFTDVIDDIILNLNVCKHIEKK